MTNQRLPIQQGLNFRQLTGYVNREHLTIKPHKLIRSGHLGQLTANDVQFLESYGVAYVMDFRTDHEIEAMPDCTIQRAEYIKNPVFSEAVAKHAIRTVDIAKNKIDDPQFGYQHLINCYHDIILSEHSRNAYRTFFDYLLKNNQDDRALLYHCSEGKDRTGMATIFLLSALDFDIETIKKDYLLTNSATTAYLESCLHIAYENHADETTIKAITDLATVRSDYVDYAFNLINERYGNMATFLEQVLNLTPEKIKKLKAIYLH
ncbi:tyrosine-protein phosphatase [Holzapfeliella sp. He02]|uniref:Tyrosine-protein phosphatase n=1 Tax=Holzapfeliella saturejae TaxID=3082953 RepID=A0ABU8SF14_9LACO